MKRVPARAAALKCGELMLADPQLRFTDFERDSLLGYIRELEALPAAEGDFIDLCLRRHGKIKGFQPESCGL